MGKGIKYILLTILTILVIIPGVILLYDLNHTIGILVGIIAAFALFVMAR